MGQGLNIVSDSESLETTMVEPPRFRTNQNMTSNYNTNLTLFEKIPSEVFIDILFSFIGAKCLFGVCRLVCKRWNKYIIGKNGLNINGIRLIAKESRKSFIKSCRRGSLAFVEGIGGQVGDQTIKHLANCSKLKRLVLEDRSLCFDSVKYISKLSNLTVLELKNVKLGSEGANLISKITNLMKLKLYATDIQDEGCKLICKSLQNLTNLEMNRNNISDQGLTEISNLSNLETLSLNENCLGDAGMLFIGQLEKLKELDLCINRIGSNGLVNLGNLNQLEVLRMSFNLIDNQGILHLCKIESLKYLDLAYNNIGAEGVKYIPSLKSIRKIRLIGNNIGEEGTEYLSRMNIATTEEWQIGFAQ